MLALYFVVVPFFYALIRLTEPSVMASMRRKWRRWLASDAASNRSSQSSDQDELKDTLSGFLTSSLNVELVYVILRGIISSVQ